MRIICMSDTHTKHTQIIVPPGDILIHAGDFSNRGELDELISFDAWLSTLPHRHKIIIAGNHDFCFENQNALARSLVKNAIYLQDEAITLAGITFYGSPWQPWFYDFAFNRKRGKELQEVWEKIPSFTDVLITHGPPFGILDQVSKDEHVGCANLRIKVDEIKPKLHVFGHIHESYGMKQISSTCFVNASICDTNYFANRPPLVFDF